jgi:hypothetical protein
MLLEIAGNYEIFIWILRWNDTALPLPASDHQAGLALPALISLCCSSATLAGAALLLK